MSLSEAEALTSAALRRAGADESQAAPTARALVASEAAGQAGHGLRRLPTYCAQIRSGKVDGAALPRAERTRAATLRIDAGNGFAFPALDLAVDALPGMAREVGVAVAAIHRSHHAGVLGLTVRRLAQAGCAALMVANSPGAIAPWGGRRALFGTNPIAFAAPRPDAEPLVIDLSLSKVARGKVMAARQRGEAIPEGWALDAEGRPTTNPEAGLAGTMAPLGDAKGAALAFAVELLAAGMTGASYAYEASSLLNDEGPPPNLGQWILAMDPVAIGGAAAVARIAALVVEVEGELGARLPGQRSGEATRRAKSEGLTVEGDVMAAIAAI